jgi:hypothetical protein
MRPAKHKGGQIWLKSKPSNTSMEIGDCLGGFEDLKQVAKKIGIMTRMEKRTKTNESAFSCVRPQTTLNINKNQRITSLK